jgi:uncharacterized protein with HEPN domain
MSSATPSPLSERDWRAYVLDMVEFCDKVQAYTAGFDLAGLLLEPMRFDAVARNLELLGEAATHVPADVRARWPDIPWRQIVATRNRLAHGYITIEPETLWLIITGHLPPLRPRLVALAAEGSPPMAGG